MDNEAEISILKHGRYANDFNEVVHSALGSATIGDSIYWIKLALLQSNGNNAYVRWIFDSSGENDGAYVLTSMDDFGSPHVKALLRKLNIPEEYASIRLLHRASIIEIVFKKQKSLVVLKSRYSFPGMIVEDLPDSMIDTDCLTAANRQCEW